MAYTTSVGAYVDAVEEFTGSSIAASLLLAVIGFYELEWVANWANIRYAGFGAALTALVAAKWNSGSSFTYLTYFSVVPAAAVTFWTVTSEGTYDDFVSSEGMTLDEIDPNYGTAKMYGLIGGVVALALDGFAIAWPYISGGTDPVAEV